jgi:hypothetical protein
MARHYFLGFPVHAFPGIPSFLHFPFPGENCRESREIKYGSFYLIKHVQFGLFFNHVCSLFSFSCWCQHYSYTHISDEFQSTFTKFGILFMPFPNVYDVKPFSRVPGSFRGMWFPGKLKSLCLAKQKHVKADSNKYHSQKICPSYMANQKPVKAAL